MRSFIGGLSLVFTLTACTPLPTQDSDRGDVAEKANQQEKYNVRFKSLTPEQRAREFQRQHERALSP